MAGSIISELNTWEGLTGKNTAARLIPLTILWIIWNKMKQQGFRREEIFVYQP